MDTDFMLSNRVKCTCGCALRLMVHPAKTFPDGTVIYWANIYEEAGDPLGDTIPKSPLDYIRLDGVRQLATFPLDFIDPELRGQRDEILKSLEKIVASFDEARAVIDRLRRNISPPFP
jgi:hypothetical protein